MKAHIRRSPLALGLKLVGGALVTAIFLLLFNMKQQEDAIAVYQQPKIGLMLYGGRDEAGWNRQHFAGVTAAARRMGIEVEVRDNVTFVPGRDSIALKQLAAQGCDFTAATSSDFSKAVTQLHADGSRMAVAVPKLDEKMLDAVPYFVRLYEGEYLAGILAGLETKTGLLGYVASTRNAEVCRSVNAFLLGARETRPDVRVLVAFVGSWSNPAAERQAAARLVARGADILNSHQDTMTVQAYADEHGIPFFDYLEPYPTGSGLNLATVSCRWDMVYEAMLHDYLEGRFRSMYWIGIENNAVGLNNFSPRVSEAARERVQAEESRLRENGSVFSDEIYDRDGMLRLRAGESLSDAALINLDWYAEGVDFL